MKILLSLSLIMIVTLNNIHDVHLCENTDGVNTTFKAGLQVTQIQQRTCSVMLNKICIVHIYRLSGYPQY